MTGAVASIVVLFVLATVFWGIWVALFLRSSSMMNSRHFLRFADCVGEQSAWIAVLVVQTVIAAVFTAVAFSMLNDYLSRGIE